jgi:RNA 2',3'-cyclic 3'-phosphodiesterase
LSREPTRRLFFALWPDEAQRTALAQAVGKVVRHCGGRPVSPESLHLTLAFLGAVPESRVALLSSVARRAASAFAARTLPLATTLSSFAHWAKPEVLVVLAREEQGAARASGLATLAAILVSESAAAGFSPDLKPFRAHVTVARKVTRAPDAARMHEVSWMFAGFDLLESRTLASGPVYSVLESHALVSTEKVRR